MDSIRKFFVSENETQKQLKQENIRQRMFEALRGGEEMYYHTGPEISVLGVKLYGSTVKMFDYPVNMAESDSLKIRTNDGSYIKIYYKDLIIK